MRTNMCLHENHFLQLLEEIKPKLVTMQPRPFCEQVLMLSKKPTVHHAILDAYHEAMKVVAKKIDNITTTSDCFRIFSQGDNLHVDHL